MPWAAVYSPTARSLPALPVVTLRLPSLLRATELYLWLGRWTRIHKPAVNLRDLEDDEIYIAIAAAQLTVIALSIPAHVVNDSTISWADRFSWLPTQPVPSVSMLESQRKASVRTSHLQLSVRPSERLPLPQIQTQAHEQESHDGLELGLDRPSRRLPGPLTGIVISMPAEVVS